jgi:hypothetical protein
MRGKTSFIIVLSAFLCTLLLGGCGSGNKQSGASDQTATSAAVSIDSGTPPATFPTPPLATTIAGSIGGAPVTAIGTLACANCHRVTTDPTTPAFNQIDVYKFYINSAHGNQPAAVSATDPAQALCRQCHDPLGDAARIIASGNLALLPAGGNIAMNGCEGCHGGGSMHWGVGSLPANKPRASRCGACHNTAWNNNPALTFHNSLFPEFIGVYEDYATSPHSRSINPSVLANATDVTGMCGRCHTDEGAKVQPITSVSGTLTQASLVTALTGRSNVVNASAVQCRTCHIAHDVGTTLARPTLIGELDLTAGTTTWSPEFKTCTYCHQLLQADGVTVNTPFHAPDNAKIITDTHFSVAGTPGYNISPTNTRSCSNCHNPHKADNTINNQFAASAHLDSSANATWILEGGTTNANCQRCHTTTGFKFYMNLVAANNNGGTTVTNVAQTLTTPGREMLYCYGCHTDSKGHLFDPKVWQYTNGNATTYVIPPGRLPAADVTFINSLGGSLLCANCHMGRTTGQFVKTSTYTTVATAASAANGDHYYGTFGLMFRIIGYEYDGVSYDNVPANTHAKIGTTAANAPGNLNGPCVGCHMFPDPGKTAANHKFNPLTRDAVTGRVTGVLAYAATCVKCHPAGEAERVNDINTTESQYAAAVQAWRAVFATRGIFYKLTSNPNATLAGTFKGDFAGLTAATWPLTAADAGNRTVGAGFNLRTLDYRLKGKGLFHNLVYTKRLVYDSIDFLDDGLINQSVDATIAALTETTAYVNETASEYQITAADKALARAFLNGGTPAVPARP